MGTKNKKQQQQALAKRESQIRNLPTIYTFNFKDVPAEQYVKPLETLFSNADFYNLMEIRNEMVRSACRIPQNSPKMPLLIKAIQDKDLKLAKQVYAALVQINLHSKVTFDFLNFGQLLRYYVDYSKPGIRETVSRLSINLDKITFYADSLEDLLNQARADMREIFDGTTEFKQFDGVVESLKQLEGFFNYSRTKDINSKDNDLYCEYADSINAYMEKRMQTYSAKYRKLHPQLPGFTQDQMIEALNLFFEENGKFNESFISTTESGGKYIDAVKLSFNIDEEQTKKLDKLVEKPKEGNSIQKYCLNVTDAIMLYYAQQKGIAFA